MFNKINAYSLPDSSSPSKISDIHPKLRQVFKLFEKFGDPTELRMLVPFLRETASEAEALDSNELSIGRGVRHEHVRYMSIASLGQPRGHLVPCRDSSEVTFGTRLVAVKLASRAAQKGTYYIICPSSPGAALIQAAALQDRSKQFNHY